MSKQDIFPPARMPNHLCDLYGQYIGFGSAGGTAGGAVSLTSVGKSALLKTGSSQTLSRSLGSAGNRRTFTISVWIYPNLALHAGSAYNPYIYGADGASSNDHGIQINNETIRFFNRTSGSFDVDLVTNALVRDIGWLHIVAALDTTAAVNRAKLYINGTEASLATNTQPSLNLDTLYNNASQIIGGSSGKYFDGYMAEFVMVEGSQLGPTSFGEFDSTGLYWTPKSSADIKALTFGTNGVYLDNATNAQTDASGEGNNWTNNNTVTTTTHTPTNIFGLANPLVKSAITYSNGNKTVVTTTSANSRAMSTLPIIGKMKMEVTVNSGSTVIVGLQSLTQGTAIEAYYYGSTGAVGGVTGSAGATFGASDVITMLVDDDAGTIEFKKNNTSQGGARTINASGYTAGEGSMCFEYGDGTTSNAVNVTIAVESGDWDYSDTATFLECSTESIASATTRTASDSKKYFDTILYEGNGEQQRVGQFQPFTDSFTVAKSALFNSANSEYFSRSWGTPTNNKIFTFSTWFKLSDKDDDVTLFSSNNTSMIDIDSSNNIRFWQYSSSAFQFNLITDLEYTDNSQWVNLVVMMDTTQSTAANRTKMYLNGVQITSFSTESYIAQDATPHMNNASYTHYIGQTGGSSNYWEGYLAETAFLDGQTLTASSFGSTDTSSGRWVPKSITGLTYGDRGFLLDYSNGSDLGEDQTGSNDFTNNNTVTQTGDSPTTNWNVIFNTAFSGGTLSNGNRNLLTGSSQYGPALGSLGIDSGKWYWEIKPTASSIATLYSLIGIARGINLATGNNLGYQVGDYGYYSYDGDIVTNNNGAGESYGASYAVDDIIGVALDLDNKTITFYKNNSSQGVIKGLLDGMYYTAIGDWNGSGTTTFEARFDSSLWSYSAPTDHIALSQDNIASSDQFISAFSWIKNRDAADNHMLFDRVRGVHKDMHSNDTAAEVTNVNTLQQFLAGGVQVGNDVEVNTANESYVLWNFMMQATGSGSALESGSINTTALVDTTLGMSVGTYTGTGSANETIETGLTGCEMIIVKRTNATYGWAVWHSGLTDDYSVLLNTSATQVNSGYWDTSGNTSTLIELGTDSEAVNKSGQPYNFIAFAPSQFISIGKYTNNNNSDGPMVSTLSSLGIPLQPVWVLTKTLASASWMIFDNKRIGYNPDNNNLLADTTVVENTADKIDIVSGGFKLRTNLDPNYSTSTTVYMAIGTPIIDTDGRIIAGR